MLAPATVGAQDFADSLARAASPRVRALDREGAALRRELDTLPRPAGAGARLGWHSKIFHAPGETAWAIVDLGREWPLDAIALVPARGGAEGGGEPGYGFPTRFRVEVSREGRFEHAAIVGEQTDADAPNPGARPVVLAAGGRAARYVRITATRLGERDGRWFAALGEIVALSGRRNVAAGASARASTSLRALPAWDMANLIDGESVLGPPVAPEPSASNGYLAQQEERADVVKWVQVDWGRAAPLDEVRLFPARPPEFADAPGHGFPVRFRVEAAAEPGFRSPRVLFDTGDADFPNPGDFPVSFDGGGKIARCVRVTATKIYDRLWRANFALAELQAWSGGENIASGAQVTALDVSDNGQPRWHPGALVDGFNSRHRILDYPEWLAGHARARTINLELARISAERATAVRAAHTRLAQFGAASAALLAALGLVLGVRARGARRRAVEDLRRRIASDLHDEIGSHLGSIALLSEAARADTADPTARADFAEIARVAGLTGEALREIVWLLEPRPMTRAELVARMRETAPTLLGATAIEWEAPETFREGACPLGFARDVWLIFKEAVHNVAKHAAAARVRVRVSEPGGGFALEIADDGQGFQPDGASRGHGLANLQRRAAALGGALSIESAPARGTTVRLAVPAA